MATDVEESFIRVDTLRQIHNRLCGLFAGPLDDIRIAKVRTLLDMAPPVDMGAPEGTKWAQWEKHFRLLLDAVDLAAITGPSPAPGPAPALAFLTPTGEPLDAAEVRGRGAAAEVAFYAAGDEVYVRRYGPYYSRSVLRNCDRPCLAIIHVIGGQVDGTPERTAQIAKAIGIEDSRLIYAADAFDAAAITTRCYDTPKIGPVAGVVAHYQSARFLALESVLRLMNRPVFVTDIDTLLQREVGDLLDKTAGDDVVFNDNDPMSGLGAQITANLLLVRPTEHAFALLAFLRDYLERYLAKAEVSRWIDQLALLNARHHLARRPGAHIGRFDVMADINNRILTRYLHGNPFRFLSLYAGFDMTSLHGLYPGAALQASDA